MPRARTDMIGRRFGRLVVEAETGERDQFARKLWRCVCGCGEVRVLATRVLTSGNTRSCGCWKVEATGNRARSHGMSRTATYRIWCLMKGRCYNERNPDYAHYGGRGIAVCNRWLESFEAFVEDMGTRPSPKHSIDRIDTNGNYEPCNCRWATQTQQTRNKRNNHTLTHAGETLTVAEWSERTGIPQRRIWKRLARGWTAENALCPGIAHRFRSPHRGGNTVESHPATEK